MNDNKIKHLEFIQNVITRMNSNSFLIKGWTVTLVSALFALEAKDTNTDYVIVSYISIPIFWILDGFYIAQERQYRELYKEVTKKEDIQVNFNMDASTFNKGKRTWLCGILSKTLIPFYGFFILITLIVMFVIKK